MNLVFQRRGLSTIFRVNIIAGDGHGRDIGKEIIEQDLRGEHGQKCQGHRSPSHAKHIAEVGADRREDVFDRVGKGDTAFINTFTQDGQIFLEQNKVSRFFSHIHSRIHRDAYVRSVQSRRIVDTIAHIADHMLGLLQREDDALFLIGIHFRERVVRSARCQSASSRMSFS